MPETLREVSALTAVSAVNTRDRDVCRYAEEISGRPIGLPSQDTIRLVPLVACASGPHLNPVLDAITPTMAEAL